MKNKASSDYGFRAVVYLAIEGRVCSSKEIADQMSIPRDYLIQLCLRLRDAGIVKAHPGKNGGYELAKKPEKISLYDISKALSAEDKQPRHPLSKKRDNGDAVAAVRYTQKVMAKGYALLYSGISVQDIIDSTNADSDIAAVLQAGLDKSNKYTVKQTGRHTEVRRPDLHLQGMSF